MHLEGDGPQHGGTFGLLRGRQRQLVGPGAGVEVDPGRGAASGHFLPVAPEPLFGVAHGDGMRRVPGRDDEDDQGEHDYADNPE